MIREYVNNVNATQDSWMASDPYYFLRIDSLDHSTNGIRQFDIGSFAAGDTVQKSSKDYASWYKLADNDASTSITFTEDISIATEGYYLIELYIRKGPTVSKTVLFDLSIAGSSVWSETGYNQWDDYGTVIRVPIQYLTAGSKSFVLTVPKYAWAGWLKISKLTRFEGGKDYIGPSETRLDLISASFTQNGVTEMDTLEVKLAMKPDFWTDEQGGNPLAFDLSDHVTFVLGEDMESSRPMFGGYVSGWTLNETQTELTLKCVDRLWDLKRALIHKNFYIGNIKNLVQPNYDAKGRATYTLDTSNGFNYTQFKNVNEIARYLCTARYKIDFDGITREYAWYNNFSDSEDVTQITSTGFDTRWETGFGHPGTCMRLIPTLIGDNEIVLYTDADGERWDAADFDIFSFSYYASGAGVKYPVRFNIEIDMYKADELPASAKTYYITFNGPTPSNTKYLLSAQSAKLNGEWQDFTCNLKDLFGAKNGSTEYHITEIRFVGRQDSSTVLNRRCSSIYIDQIMAFRNMVFAPNFKSAGANSAYEELYELCNNCNQIAYIRPGMERSEDQLLMLPQRYYTIPVTIDGSNIREVSNLEYHPIEWGVHNAYTGTWSLQGKTSTTTKTVNIHDTDHMKHYGIIQERESMSDIVNANDASYYARNKLEQGVNRNMAFDVEINGSTLIEPGQYITVNLSEYHINGLYEIASIVHSIDFVSGLFLTQLDFTRPSSKFSKMITALKKAMRDIDTLRMNTSHDTAGSMAGGMETSLGAYE